MMLMRAPGVYRAESDTEVLIAEMHRGAYATGRRVLDLGTGTGAVALAAARAGASSVTAVDLSARSVAAARLNAGLAGLAVDVRRGDLFAPVAGERFDLVVSNPPYVPARTQRLPRHARARCWDGGTDGRAVLDRICSGAADVLSDDGQILLVHSALCGTRTTVDALGDAGFAPTVLTRVRIPFGPVLRARAAMLEERGMIAAGERVEELVVVAGIRGEKASRADDLRTRELRGSDR
nr:HemK2/MTQ2 family protein methyltransferase [Pseudonocardia sp.]